MEDSLEKERKKEFFTDSDRKKERMKERKKEFLNGVERKKYRKKILNNEVKKERNKEKKIFE